MAKSVRLIDIAKTFGVSTVTVSKALSGQKGVSQELREKIIRLADELGYKQPSAWNKEQEKEVKISRSIGVLIHEKYFDAYDSFYLQMYRQVAMAGSAKGHSTLMELVTEEMEREHLLPKLVQEQKADGLLLVGRLSAPYLQFLRLEAKLPQVYLDFYDPSAAVDAVVSNNFDGGYMLTHYLLEMGHKKIGYVGTLCATDSITDRYLGYIKALLEYGAPIRPDWQIDDREKEGGRLNEAQFFQLPKEMPTAFVCNCDQTAGLLIRKLQAAGWKVPEQISVVGYDNYPYPGLNEVAITSFSVDIQEMARCAIHTLVQKLQDPAAKPRKIIVDGHLVQKDSVKQLL